MVDEERKDEDEEIEIKEDNKLKTIFWIIVFITGIGLIVLYYGVLRRLDDLLGSLEPLLPKVAVVLLTIFLANLFITLTRPLVRKAYHKHAYSKHEGRIGDWKVIVKIYSYVIWALTGLIIFVEIFGSPTNISISLGIIGAGIAFALQQPILSFSGWFLIVLKRPFSIGDRVILVNQGIMGDVDDITMFYFVLKETTKEESQTGKSVIVPNSAVFHGPIINYSYDTPHIWVNIPFSVTYESDLALAEKLIYQAGVDVAGEEMKRSARIIRRLFPDSVMIDLLSEKPKMRVDFGDSSVNITLRIMCLPKQVRNFKSAIYREVLSLFNEKENKGKVEIAYPHMEVVAHGSFQKTFK